MDMPESQENLKESSSKIDSHHDEFDELPHDFLISSLAHAVWQFVRSNGTLLDKTEFLALEDEMAQEEVYYGFDEDQPAFDISRDDDAAWSLVWWEKLEKLFNMTNFDRDEAVMKFARPVRGMRCWWNSPARGARPIGKFEFEFVD